jgi:putative holliday junction resolvase
MSDNFKNVISIENKRPEGRLIAIDLGSKTVGVAVCDELQITARPLPSIQKTGWKKLLNSIFDFVKAFDAKALVIGLPLNFDGSESLSSTEARRMAKNFALSLKIPVYLQDERLTSVEANERLINEGVDEQRIKNLIDSRAATIILEDFLSLDNPTENKVKI